MRILIISSTCSAEKYKEIYNTRVKPMLDTNQKFFLSLIEGLNANRNITVDCVTTLPISYSCYKKRILKKQKEAIDGVTYCYCGCINYPVIRTLTVRHNILRLVKKYIKQHRQEETVVLCDGLIAEANSVVKFLKKNGIPTVALVTDIPNIVSDMSQDKGLKTMLGKIYGNYATKLLRQYDKYVFLTEQMNEVCNLSGVPYMIMECIVTPIELDAAADSALADKPVVLYAGKLHSDFGVLQLAKAAPLLKDKCEIWLYGGQGNCDDELANLAERYPNLKIHGIVTLKEIQSLEQRATVLINPRPNEKAFTKYSFPSKTAEYMMMNTPVLMFRLDGIPPEYEQYLSFIEENSPEGIAESIAKLLEEDKIAREDRSKKAREYIINNKNNIHQAERLYKFLKAQ